MKRMKPYYISYFLTLLAGSIAQGQECRDQPLPPKIEAAQQAYLDADVAVVACVYKIEQEGVTEHTKRAVISATVTAVFKGNWEIGKRITISKYFDAPNQFKLEPGALRFLLLPETEPGEEIVAGSGEMPEYSKELHEVLNRLHRQELESKK